MTTAIEHAQEGLPETVPPVQTSADPATPKKKYQWQPLDDDGNAIGGMQVIEYETPEELADKLRDQNISLQRELRKKKREADSLRPLDPTTIPENAERRAKPKPLTDAERVQLSKDMLDPAKMQAAFRRLAEADGETEAARHQRVQREAQEGDVWQRNHPEYYECAENNRAMVAWCYQRELLVTQANLDVAFKQLKEAGLLLEAPIAAVQADPETPDPAQPDPEAGLPPERVTPPPRRPESTSSGLTRRQLSAAGSPPARRGLTWADVDKMPFDEYDRKYRSDAQFRKQVDALPRR